MLDLKVKQLQPNQEAEMNDLLKQYRTLDFIASYVHYMVNNYNVRKYEAKANELMGAIK